jgi:hypothetical protein
MKAKALILGNPSMLEVLEQEGFKPMPQIPDKMQVRLRIGVKTWITGDRERPYIDAGPMASIEAVSDSRDRAEPDQPGASWSFVLKVNRAGMVPINSDPQSTGLILSTADPQQARTWIRAIKDYAARNEHITNLYNWSAQLQRFLLR